MRERDGILLLKNLVGSKVGNVCCNLAALECLRHCLGVNQLAARKIDDANAVLHLLDRLCADGVLRVSVQRNMNGDVVAVCENLVQLGNVLDRAVELECAVNRQVRVIAPDLHIQANSRICNLNADRTQTDDAQLLAGDFRACVGGLALLCSRTDIRRALEALNPVCALYHLAGSQQQCTDNQLLNGVSICTRRVEDYDAFLGAAVDRNVVDTGTCTRDAAQVLRELDVMQLGRTDQNGVIIGEILGAGVLCRIEIVQTYLRDLVVEFYVIHGIILQ